MEELKKLMHDACEFMRQGDFENAMNTYIEVLEKDPAHADAKNMLDFLQIRFPKDEDGRIIYPEPDFNWEEINKAISSESSINIHNWNPASVEIASAVYSDAYFFPSLPSVMSAELGAYLTGIFPELSAENRRSVVNYYCFMNR